MGLSDRGELAVGKRADIVIMDSELSLKKVILCGEPV
jgi:N-acetylglucosamine-6-phosphate deacetylase